LLRDATNVLLDGVPARLTLNSVRGAISTVPGVASLHELHIWSMSQDDISLTAHVSVAPEAAADDVRKAIETMVEREFDITHLAIQMETANANCQPGVPAHT
jgi:cobalt-zinc-cadmium efflux system protein